MDQIFRVSKAERAPQMHARTLKSRLRFDNPLHWSNGHKKSSLREVFDEERAIQDS